MQGACNPVAVRLHRLLDAGRPAVATGRLYALPEVRGWYPALVPDGAGTPVYGQVHAVPAQDCVDVLRMLDEYEDCRADGSGEYCREEIAVATGATTLRAFAYIYNAPLPVQAVSLAGGDFAAFVADRNLPTWR